MATSHPLLLAFYGDDFTGSTDALESIARWGAKAALFIKPPTPAQLARQGGLQAIGVAGMSRSMTPEAMEPELTAAFTALKALDAPHVHYKICSTFDSSPTIGSIGRAIDVGAKIFGAGQAGRFVPLLVGAPPLGRYCVFGNLFARMGIASAGAIYRLDRHPSMSHHPVTPADEGDLRVHLARQTRKRIGLFDILQVSLPDVQARAALEKLLADPPASPEIVLFDVLHTAELERIGALLDPYGSSDRPLFSAGSSGIEMALGAHWAAQGRLKPVTSWPDPGRADPLLVLSGSCSPVTARQIDWALAHGFADVALDTRAIAEALAVADAMAVVTGHLKASRSVILHTWRGDSDDKRKMEGPSSARILGGALGRAARGALEQRPVRRVVIAGGDTSSYAARALGIESVEMIAPLYRGAPLCRASAPGSPVDGIEVCFKGGQVGPEDFFDIAARGKL